MAPLATFERSNQACAACRRRPSRRVRLSVVTRHSIPTIQVFDCRALFLYLLARQVPRAAGGILRFAGQPLGDAVGRQLRISDESAETLDQCAFDLMGDALPPASRRRWLCLDPP
jgi:hypothetical protein